MVLHRNCPKFKTSIFPTITAMTWSVNGEEWEIAATERRKPNDC